MAEPKLNMWYKFRGKVNQLEIIHQKYVDIWRVIYA